ncbi:MAG: hypothetical protein IJB49_03755 [Clostridia bacterium]|nr:hypothetical protein [Clostridia bacterium]
MKKTMIFILSVILAVSLFSCSAPRKFEVAEASGYDSNSIVKRHNEINTSTENYKKILKFNKNATINGQIIVGEYTRTKETYLYNGEKDYYETIDGYTPMEFGINTSTGVVCSYQDLSMDYLEKRKNTDVLSESECLEIAKQYFNNYADADAYTLVKTRYLTIPEYQAIYKFKFSRLVDGIETSDNAYICVTVFGDVISHLFGTLNEMDELPELSEEDYKTIEANVDAKVNSIFEPVKDKYDYSYSLSDPETDKRFVKLSDGTYALEYFFSVKLLPKVPSVGKKSEGVKLFVYLE